MVKQSWIPEEVLKSPASSTAILLATGLFVTHTPVGRTGLRSDSGLKSGSAIGCGCVTLSGFLLLVDGLDDIHPTGPQQDWDGVQLQALEFVEAPSLPSPTASMPTCLGTPSTGS